MRQLMPILLVSAIVLLAYSLKQWRKQRLTEYEPQDIPFELSTTALIIYVVVGSGLAALIIYLASEALS